MQRKTYRADCGSVAILCGESVVLYNSDGGDSMDGNVYLFRNDQEFVSYLEEKRINKYYFISSAKFKNAYVLNYDCLNACDVEPSNILFTLNGAYGIYNNLGDVYLVKWGEIK